MQFGVPQIIAAILLVGVIIALIWHRIWENTPESVKEAKRKQEAAAKLGKEKEPEPTRAPYIFPSSMAKYLGNLDPSYNPTVLHDHLCKKANGQPLQTLARIVLDADVPEDERAFEIRFDLRQWSYFGPEGRKTEHYGLVTIVNDKVGTIWMGTPDFDPNGVCTIEFPFFGAIRNISVNGLEPVQTFTFPIGSLDSAAVTALRAVSDSNVPNAPGSDLHRFIIERAKGHETATVGHIVLTDGRPSAERLLPIGIFTKHRKEAPEGETYRVIINSIDHGLVLNKDFVFDSSGTSTIEFELLAKTFQLTLNARGPVQRHVLTTDSSAPAPTNAQAQ